MARVRILRPRDWESEYMQVRAHELRRPQGREVQRRSSFRRRAVSRPDAASIAVRGHTGAVMRGTQAHGVRVRRLTTAGALANTCDPIREKWEGGLQDARNRTLPAPCGSRLRPAPPATTGEDHDGNNPFVHESTQ